MKIIMHQNLRKMLATGKKDDFQAIVSQIESHNEILVNNFFESLEKVLPEYQISQPSLNFITITLLNFIPSLNSYCLKDTKALRELEPHTQYDLYGQFYNPYWYTLLAPTLMRYRNNEHRV